MTDPSNTTGWTPTRTERTLLLLRHAKSAWGDPGLIDKERPLNAKGRKAARAMAPRIAEWRPDHIVCSNAQRTRETLAPIIPALAGEVHIELTDALYWAEQTTYLKHARTLPEPSRCALLIGHNPTLEDLLHDLISEADPILMHRIAAKYPTGTLAVIECPIERWQDLTVGNNKLIDIVRPADLPTEP